jgi:hypothetical protein
MPIAADLRIDHVTVIDPRDGTRRQDVSVLVRNGVIASVAPSGSAAGVDAWAIDGAGRFVVPGYNNMHTHVLQEQERSELFMAAMLADGTTGLRQMAGSADLLRYRGENRLGLGPRTPGLLAMPGALLMPWNAGTVDEVRETIAQQKQQGADFVKLIQTDRDVFFAAIEAAHRNGLMIGGHLPPTISPGEASDAGYDSFEHLGAGSNIWIESSTRAAELRGEVDPAGPVPAWLTGLPFAEHLFATDLVSRQVGKQLINPALSQSAAAIDIMRRALDSFDERAATALAETFARNGTWQTPTLVRLRTQYRADDPEYDQHPWERMMSEQAVTDYREVRRRFLDLPEATRSAFHEYYDMSLRMVGLLHAAGVPIMTGTDGPGGNPGQDMQSEFRELADAGLGPLDVLRSTTTVPAAHLGRADRMGVVDAGMDADFLLLDADPLTDVRNLASIAAIVRAGHFLPRVELDSFIDRLAALPA